MLKYLFILFSLTLVNCSEQSATSLSKSEQAITNGVMLTKIGEFPASRSLVLIQKNRNGLPGGFCTGVIIDKNVGLTAAHCFEGFSKSDSFKVIFDFSQWGSIARVREGLQVIAHPEFHSQKQPYTFDFGGGQFKTYTLDNHHDLAVFSFSGEFPSDAKIAKVFASAQDLSNEPIYIYGAGHSAYINEKTVGPQEYKYGRFGRLRRGKANVHTNYSELPTMYFTSPTSEAHTCRGDSGGPQFLASAKYPTVIGINSAMFVNDTNPIYKDSACGHSAIAVKLAPLASWIETQKSLLQGQL